MFKKIKEKLNKAWQWIKSKLKKIFIGSIVLASTVTGGGIIADNQINPYTEKPTHFEIQTDRGDEGFEKVRFAKDKPEMILGKWNDEVKMSVAYTKIKNKGKKKFLSKKLEWQGVNEKVIAYPITDGYEFEIELKKKPDSNVFDFEITGAENLDFFYQYPLNVEFEEGMIPEANNCTETQCFDIDGNVITERPENIVGSYAVYHKTKSNYRIGQTNYATGKAFHIYRPKIIDNVGDWVWGDLSFANGVLRVIAPQSFLNIAVYPVIIDPTFGYTTAGGSSFFTTSALTNYIIGGKFTLSENGGVYKVTAQMGGTAINTPNLKGAIYNDSSETLGSLSVGSSDISWSSGLKWYDFTISTTTLTSGDYWLVAWSDDVDTDLYISLKTDSGDVNDFCVSDINNYGAWPDPFPAHDTFTGYKISIYATYQKLPSFSNISASSILDVSATLNADLDIGDEATSTVWFDYGIDSTFTASSTEETLTASTTLAHAISSLTTFEEYGYRPVATSSQETVFGTTYQFFTADISTSTPVVIADNHSWDLAEWDDGTHSTTTDSSGILKLLEVQGEGGGWSTTTIDSFTDTNGVNLDVHTPDTGTGWTKTAGSCIMEIFGNALEVEANLANNGAIYTTQPDPSVVTQRIQWQLTDPGTGATNGYHLIGHYVDTSNFYVASMYGSGSAKDLVLGKYVGGSFTELDSDGTDMVDNDIIRLEIDTNSQKVFKNGVELLTATDSTVALQVAGKAGVGVGAITNGTDDCAFEIDYDNFRFATSSLIYEDGEWLAPSWNVNAVDYVDDSFIEWATTTPSNTNVEFMTAVNTSATVPPASGDYATSTTNGGNIAGISANDDLTGKFLWVKIVMTADAGDSSVTPEVEYFIIALDDGTAPAGGATAPPPTQEFWVE